MNYPKSLVSNVFQLVITSNIRINRTTGCRGGKEIKGIALEGKVRRCGGATFCGLLSVA